MVRIDYGLIELRKVQFSRQMARLRKGHDSYRALRVTNLAPKGLWLA